MTLSRNAIGNLINRYKAVLGKCRLLNTFGSLAVASVMVLGGAGMAWGAERDWGAGKNITIGTPGTPPTAVVIPGSERITAGMNAANVIIASDGTLILNPNLITGSSGGVSVSRTFLVNGLLQVNAPEGRISSGHATTIMNGGAVVIGDNAGLTLEGGTVTQDGAVTINAGGDLTIANSVTYTASGDIRHMGTINVLGDVTLSGRVLNSGANSVVNIGTTLATTPAKLTVGQSQLNALKMGKINVGGSHGLGTLQANTGNTSFDTNDFTKIKLYENGVLDVFDTDGNRVNTTVTLNGISSASGNSIRLDGGTIKTHSFNLKPNTSGSSAYAMQLEGGALQAVGNGAVIQFVDGSDRGVDGTLVVDGGKLILGGGGTGEAPASTPGEVKASLVLAGTKEPELDVVAGNWESKDIEGKTDGFGNMSVQNGATLTAASIGKTNALGKIDAQGAVVSSDTIRTNEITLGSGTTTGTATATTGNIEIGNKITSGHGTLTALAGNVTLNNGADDSALSLTAGRGREVNIYGNGTDDHVGLVNAPTLNVGNGSNGTKVTVDNVTADNVNVEGKGVAENDKAILTVASLSPKTGTVSAPDVSVKKGKLVATATGTTKIANVTLADGEIEAENGSLEIRQKVQTVTGSGTLTSRQGDVNLVDGSDSDKLAVNAVNGTATFGGNNDSKVKSVDAATITKTGADRTLTVTEHLAGTIQSTGNHIKVDGALGVNATVALEGNSTAKDVTFNKVVNGTLGNELHATNNMNVTDSTIVGDTTSGATTKYADVIVGDLLQVTRSTLNAKRLDAASIQIGGTNAKIVTHDNDLIVHNPMGSDNQGLLKADGGKVVFEKGVNAPEVKVEARKNNSLNGEAGNVVFDGNTNSKVKSVVADGTITVTSDYYNHGDPANPDDWSAPVPRTLTVTEKLEGTLAGHEVNRPAVMTPPYQELHYSNYVVDGSVDSDGNRLASIALKGDNHANNVTVRNAEGSLGESLTARGNLDMDNAILTAKDIVASTVNLNNRSELTTTTLTQTSYLTTKKTTIVDDGSILRVRGERNTGTNFSGNLVVGNNASPTPANLNDDTMPHVSKAYINPNSIDPKKREIVNATINVRHQGMVALGFDPTEKDAEGNTLESTFLAKMYDSMSRAAKNGSDIKAVLYLDSPTTVGQNGSIVVDGTKHINVGTTTEPYKGNGKVEFGEKSLLVVNATNASAEKPYLTAATIEGVHKAALDIQNAKYGETYAILDKKQANATDFGSGKNVTSSSRVLNPLYADGKVTISNTPAEQALPGIDGSLHGLIDQAVIKGEIGLGSQFENSNMGGVRFLSRATNTTYIADAGEAAKTIEGATRLGTVAAVPQMAVAANSLGADAIAQRTSLAMPPSSMTAIGISGGDETAGMSAGEPYGQEGIGVWAMPLYQSSNGKGMKAGDHKVDFNGSLGGVAAGIDYTVPDAARVGVTFNMGSGETKGSGDFASTTNKMKFWGVGAYVGVMAEEMAFTADVSYTATSNDIKQKGNPKIGMGDFKADVKAQAIGAGVRGEYRYQTESVDIIPHAGVRYTSISTDDYDVKAGGMKVMKASGGNQTIWSFPVGVQFSKNVELQNDWYVKPSLDLNITPSVGDVETKNDIRFTGVSDKATMQTQTMDQITYGGQVGLEIGNDAVQLGINYNLQMGEKTTNHGVFGTFRYNF